MTYDSEIASLDARYLCGELSADEYDRIYGNVNERYGVGRMTKFRVAQYKDNEFEGMIRVSCPDMAYAETVAERYRQYYKKDFRAVEVDDRGNIVSVSQRPVN